MLIVSFILPAYASFFRNTPQKIDIYSSSVAHTDISPINLDLPYKQGTTFSFYMDKQPQQLQPQRAPYATKVAVAIAGAVDSGKSSFIGVLVSGKLDDGNGSARKLVAKHPHEITSGKTSDIMTSSIIVPETNSALSIIDLCGHESYLHTTALGISGCFPDYACVVISANRGLKDATVTTNNNRNSSKPINITKEHMKILQYLSIPIIIIVTHVDIAPPEIYKNTINEIREFIQQRNSPFKMHMFNEQLDDTDDVTIPIKQKILNEIPEMMRLTNGRQFTYPVVAISNKTGYYLDVVSHIIKTLPPRQIWISVNANHISNNFICNGFLTICKNDKLKAPLMHPVPYVQDSDKGIFYIDNVYSPPGIGMVVTGIYRNGLGNNDLQSGSTAWLGPVGKDIIEFRVKGIHNNVRELRNKLEDHDRGTIAMAFSKKNDCKRSQIRKGMVVMTDPTMIKNICYRFKAVVNFVSNESMTIKNDHAPVIHINNIRQSARIIIDPAENGDKEIIQFEKNKTKCAVVTFKFKSNPEYIEPYSVFILRCNSIHGFGMILQTLSAFDDPDGKPDYQKCKRHKGAYAAQ